MKEEEYAEAFTEALKEYLEPAANVFPMASAIRLKKPITFFTLHVTLNEGNVLYLINDEVEKQPIEECLIYSLAKFDVTDFPTPEELKAMEENGEVEIVEENGMTRVIPKNQEVKLSMEIAFEKVYIKGDEQPLRYGTLLLWAAITEAHEKGDTERIQAILQKAYGGRITYKQTEPETTIKALTRPLDNMPINHSFAMKVLEGFEDIPYGDGSGTFTLEAKKGTGQKTVLSATPEACRDFIANDGANWEYAARIAAVVYELIRKPEAAAMKTEGRVWVTTNTIVKELTRTAQGVNTYAARDKAFRKLVMDGLKALSSAQISSYDASGNLQFMGYLLQAEYLAEAKDAAGNTIKDIWGFSVDKEALAFAVFTEKSTVNAPLLDMKPMKKSNAWIVQALRGDVLSEIRAKLYPKRGKGVKQYTAKRDWVEVFKSADVKADGDIRSSVKQRIVNDFEEQLRALAVNEKNADKPIYLEARATRDARRGKGGGAWLKLEVTGHKTFSNKYRIDLSGQ